MQASRSVERTGSPVKGTCKQNPELERGSPRAHERRHSRKRGELRQSHGDRGTTGKFEERQN